MVLAAARDVFSRNGFHAASMDEIAEAAGVSKPVLYQHFPGKQELYEALLDDASEGVIRALQCAIATADGPRGRVHATMEAFFEIVVDPNSGLRLVFESDLVGQPEIRQKIDEVLRRAADVILSQLQLEIDLPEPEIRLLSIYLVGMAEVGARYWMEHKQDKIAKERAIDIAAFLMWRGLRTFPARGQADLATEGADDTDSPEKE